MGGSIFSKSMRARRARPVRFIGGALFGAMLCSGLPVAQASAGTECTLVIERVSGTVLHREGACDRRLAPASTFKVPLAVMGYEAGILKDAQNPAWTWKPEFDAPQRDRKTVDPTIWERDSVLWYSREITRKMGQAAFAAAVNKLDYGNRDVSGAKGRNNGLTHSWLGASLEISADEQARFIRGLVNDDLPVSGQAMAATRAIIPAFRAADGSVVHGKTGSTWLRTGAGEYDRNRPLGWFVGWSRDKGRDIVFVRMKIDDKRASEPAGPRLRDAFLKELPGLMTKR